MLWNPSRGGAGTLIYDFEDQDLTQHFDNVDSSFNNFTTTAFEGTYAHDPSNSSFDKIDSQPGDGLNAYVNKGDEIDAYIYITNTNVGKWALNFATQDTDNHYRILLDPPNDNFRLQIVDGGSISDISSAFGYSYSSGVWRRLNIKRGDGSSFSLSDNDLQATLYDTSSQSGNQLVQESGNDSTFASEVGLGITWNQSTSGEGVLTDNWVRNQDL